MNGLGFVETIISGMRVLLFTALLALSPLAVWSDYYLFTGSSGTPAGWGVQGTWSRNASVGMICSSDAGSITNGSPVTVSNTFAVAFKAIGYAQTNTLTVRLTCYSSGASIWTHDFTELNTDSRLYTCFPEISTGTPVTVGLQVIGLAAGKTVSIYGVFMGTALEYDQTWNCAKGIGDGWTSANGWWSQGANMYSADLQFKSSALRDMLVMRHQLKPPQSDNIEVSYEIYSETNAPGRTNDFLQVYAHTNSWIITPNSPRVAIDRQVARFAGGVTNAWRQEVLTSYVPGITGINTFELGFEAIPGGSSQRYLKIRNIKVRFKTDVASDGLLWKNGSETNRCGDNLLSYGGGGDLVTRISQRPEGDVSNLVVTVYRQAVSRGETILSCVATTNGLASGLWKADNLTLPYKVEAGETNRARMVCEYTSARGFQTSSPQLFPGPTTNDWYTDVVQNLGTVWVNEIGRSNGNIYVEIASHNSRSIPTDSSGALWTVVFDGGVNGSITTNIPAHDFTDQNQGIGFLTFNVSTNIPVNGIVRLINAANVCEFEKPYTLPDIGAWGALGVGGYETNRLGYTQYALKYFSYGTLTTATPGCVNDGQGIEKPIGFRLSVGALDSVSASPIQYVRINATPLFSHSNDQAVAAGVTLETGYTTNFTFSGNHTSTAAVEVCIAPLAFGYFGNDVVTNVSNLSLGAPYPLSLRTINLDAGPGFDAFNLGSIPSYWEQVQINGNVAWEYETLAANSGRIRADCQYKSSQYSTVIKAKNGISSRGKKAALVSLNTYNKYDPSRAFDMGIPKLSTNATWSAANTNTLVSFPAFYNRYDSALTNTSVPYLSAYRAETDDQFRTNMFVGVEVRPGGSSLSYVYVDDYRVSFQDMLLPKNVSVRLYAASITNSVRMDIWADLDVWGGSVTRVLPKLLWKRAGVQEWATVVLTPYVSTNMSPGVVIGAQALGTFKDSVSGYEKVITVTNSTHFVATNLVVASNSSTNRFEYYLKFEYDPDDADPTRRSAGLNTEPDLVGSLNNPEIRYAPDNAVKTNGFWLVNGVTYAPKSLTNSLNGISDVWINEVSRNLNADDADDFIELAGPTNTSVAGWTVEVQDLANLDTLPAVYTNSGTLTAGATNGYAFYVLGGSSVPQRQQLLTLGLPEQCGVTLKDSAGNIRYRLAFNTTNGVAYGFQPAVETNAASWSACGKGNPAYQQYAWTGSGILSAGSVNNTAPAQEMAPGGPVGDGVTAMTAESTESIRITVSGAVDPDGVATGIVYVTQDQGPVTNFGFNGTSTANFVVTNLSENVKYTTRVVYSDINSNENYGASIMSCYTLLSSPPAAPASVARSTNSITVAAAIENLGDGDTRAWFYGPFGSSGDWQTGAWTCTGLSANTRYGFSVKGRNGDRIETAVSTTNAFYTLANCPTAGVGLASSALNGSLTVCVNNLTNDGATAFGNPAYTRYMLIHSNIVDGVGGYVTTNGQAAGTANVSANEDDAAWLPITDWNNVAVFGMVLSNRFYLVACNQDGIKAFATTGSLGVVSMQVALQTANQVAGVPQELEFSGSFMNPAAAVTTNQLALQFSTDNGANWSKATIKSGSVTLGVGGSPTVDNGQDYPIRDVPTADYTNRLASARWLVTNNLASGADYTVRLRLDMSNAVSGAVSPALTNLTIDLSAPAAVLLGVPSGYTTGTNLNAAVGSSGVAYYKWRLELSSSYGASSDWSDLLPGDGWSAETAVATPITRSGLVQGRYRLSAIGRDAAGNWQSVASAAVALWNVDTQAPTAAFLSMPAKDVSTNTVTFVMAYDPPTNAVSWKYAVADATGVFGPTNAVSATNAFTVTVTSDGDYSIRVWAKDQAGNEQSSGSPTTYDWTVDRVAPVAVLQGLPGAFSQDSALNVTVTNAASAGHTNTVTHYRWKLDRDGQQVTDWSAETAVASKITQGLTQDGAYALSAIGRDAAGNWQAVPGTSAAWVRDTAASNAWFSAFPALNNGYLNTNRLTFTFGKSGEVDASQWTFSVTPGVTNVSSWTAGQTHTVTIATNGIYVLSAWARDAAGNVSTSATTVAVRVDTAAPAAGEVALGVTPAVAPNGLSNQTNFTFQVTVELPALFGGGTDTGATYRCQFNNGPTSGVTAVNASTTLVSAAGGAVTNTFRVWAADWLGNAQTSATNFTWVVDTEAPVAVLQGVPGAYSTNSALNVTVTSSAAAGDLNAVMAYRWKLERDGATVADWSSETAVAAKITQSLTQDGAYTLSVIGRDAAGNWQKEPGTFVSWVRDTAAAAAWFAIPPALNKGYLNTNRLAFTFGTAGATDAAEWTYSVVPGVTNVSSWTTNRVHTVTVATNGVYTLSAWARDAAGNVSGAATNVTFKVDTAAPAANEVGITSLDVGENGLSNRTNFTFQVTVALPALFGGGTDTGATYRCQFNNGPTSGVISVNASTTVVSATGGAVTNTFRVWASDWLGNAQTVPTNFTWVVDTAAPSAAFKVEPGATDGTWQTNQSWTVTVTGDTQVVAYTWQLDNGAVSGETNAAAFSVSGLSESNHTVRVWGRDLAGNWQAQTNPAVYARIVDVTAPTAVLTNVPPSNTTQTWARVSVTNAPSAAVQDTVVRYRWQLTGQMSAGGDVTNLAEIVLSALQDGSYTLNVWGYDPAGNLQKTATTKSWTVDTVAPVAAFKVSPPANGKWMTNTVWTVDVTGGVDVAAFRYTIDNPVMPAAGETAVTGFPTRVTTGTLTQKECTLYVWGRDVAGNWQTGAATFTKTVDTLAPADVDVCITNTPPIVSNSSNWTFRVVSNDVAFYQWKLDGAGYSAETPVAQDFEVKGLADGSHTVSVLGRDQAGNWNPAPASFTWTVDVTPPAAVTIGNRPVADGGRTNATAWSFTVGGAEVDAYCWTTNDVNRPSGDTPVATPLTVDALKDGTYVLRVWGRDAAGNWLETPALYTWTVDTQAPVARFRVLPSDNSGWQTNNTWTVTVTGDTQVVAYQWQLDNGAYSSEILTNAATFVLSDLSESNHTVRVKGRDAAGNWQTLNVQEYSAIVDTIKPVAILTNVPAYYTKTNAIAVVVTNAVGAEEKDRIAAYRWRLTRDGNTVSDWAWTNMPAVIQSALAQDGVYELSVAGRDPAGNWQLTPGTVTNWIRDTFAPAAWFETRIPSLTNSPTVSFRMGSTGSLDAVQWHFEVWRGTCVTSNAWSSSRDYTVDLSGYADGIYTNLVWGRDAAGNAQSLPTTNIWALDTTPPSVSEIAITNTPGAEWLRTNQTSYTFGVRVNQSSGAPDDQAVYKYRLNAGPTSGVTAVSQTFAVSSETGPNVTNTVTVWGRDAALNWQTNGVAYRWIVDTVAPVATFVAAPPAYTNSRALTFTVAAGTDAVAWRFSVAGVTNGVTASRTFVVNVANDGAYTLSVWARDVAGNEQSAATVTNWTVDTVAPNAEFASTPAALVNTRTVSFTVKNDGDSVAWRYSVTNSSGSVVAASWITAPTTTFSVTVPAADGSYSISLFGRDRAGNESAMPVMPGGVYTWRLDTQAPVGAQFVAAEMPRDPTNRMDVVAVMAADADIAQWSVSLFKLDAASNETAAVTVVTVANTNGGSAPVSAAVMTLAADGSQDGVYRLKVVGRDAVGNWQSAPLTNGIWTWRYDRTPPVAVFSQTPVSPTTNTVASFVASNLVEKVVRWRYCVLTNGADYLAWTETTNAAFSVTVPAASVTGVLYTCKLLGYDAAGNLQAEANPTNGWAEWQVIKDKDSQNNPRLITKVIRNTTVTNGNLEVELVFTYHGDQLPVGRQFVANLGERLPAASSSMTMTAFTNVAPDSLGPWTGDQLNVQLKSWNRSSSTSWVYYVVSGLTTNSIKGQVTWSNNSTDWSLVVERGTHKTNGTNQPPANPYAVWAAQYGLSAGSEAGDADGDGLTNEEEWWVDTDPTNTVTPSVFTVKEISKASGAPSQVFIHVSAGTNAVLTVQKTASLSNPAWIDVTPSSKVYESVDNWLIGIDVTEPEAFFRVRADPPSAQ